MPTNAIGTGTCNLSLNVPVEERAVLGRLAFEAGARSVGDFLRGLVLNGLEQRDESAARRVREIRRRYYGAVMIAIFVASLAVGEKLDMRRARRVEEFREEEI